MYFAESQQMFVRDISPPSSRSNKPRKIPDLARIIRPWRWRRYIPLKHWLTFSGLHSVISHKAVLFITSNPTIYMSVHNLETSSTRPARFISHCSSRYHVCIKRNFPNSRNSTWRLLHSEMWRNVVFLEYIIVSKQHSTFIVSVVREG
jgi:hypothetical protein